MSLMQGRGLSASLRESRGGRPGGAASSACQDPSQDPSVQTSSEQEAQQGLGLILLLKNVNVSWRAADT